MTDRLSPEEISKVKAVINIVAEAIEALGSVPAGHLYARVMQHLSYNSFEAVISLLVGQGKVRRQPSHLLTWIGPKKEGK